MHNCFLCCLYRENDCVGCPLKFCFLGFKSTFMQWNKRGTPVKQRRTLALQIANCFEVKK